MAIGEDQIKYLLETIERIEKENNESMKALISRNTALEAKRVQERKTLNERIVMQKATFDKEREQILQGNTKRELDLSNQLAALKNNLESKELEISSLKLAVSEISTKLDAATTLSETLRKARDESVAKLESVKATNKKDRDKSLVELESVKAVNANLNKNLAELSNKLASQNRPIQNSPTKTNN
jgi:chromosome segregation ATPase